MTSGDSDPDVAARDHLSPAEAFSLLGNETRMSIIESLWEADGEPVPFSELHEAVGVDRGNFNYHLDRLRSHFVRRTDEGYELRHAGQQIVRAVLSGSITEEVHLEPTELEEKCPFCGSRVEMRYDEDLLTVRCTNCAGVVGGTYPSGTYLSYAFPPAGFTDRSPAEVLDAAHTFYDSKITPMMEGVCPECAGATAVSIEICEDHDGEGGGTRICDRCGSTNRIWTVYGCGHCGYTRRSLVWFSVVNHPEVISFYEDVGGFRQNVPFKKLTWENASYVREITESVVSRDPLRIRIVIPFEGRELRATVDESLEMIEMFRH